MYDLIVIGAGPAGVSAALYARSRGLNLLVIEQEAVGGLIGKVSLVSHFSSVKPGETGPEFAKRLQAQLEAAEIPIVYEKILKVEKTPDGFVAKARDKEFTATKLIIAAGVRPKELPIEIPNNVTIHNWALGREELVRDKTVVVNGGSDGAAKEALYLAKFAKQVHIVQDQDRLLCIAEFKEQIEAANNIEVHCSSTLTAFDVQDKKLVGVKLSSGEITDPNGLEVFAMIGLVGNTEAFAKLVNLKNSFIEAHDLPAGLFVAGDIAVKDIKQVATAVASGCQAGILAAK